MGEIKPVGSEKLKGDAKLRRILELTYYNTSDNSAKSSEVIKESKSGNVYGIVKEKDGYYVKMGLNENSLDYIGGLYMKNKNKFSSYGEAFKKLEFLTEQENIQEATKYILKRPAPATPPAPQEEAPAPMATNEPAPPPSADPMDSPDAGAPPPSPEDGLGAEDPNAEPENPDEYLKIIQKMTGRLTQKLNTYQDRLESKDIKYVLNMVLASVDLDKMDEADKDEVLSKLEGDEEEIPGEETHDTVPNDMTPAPAEENEMGETGMSGTHEVDGMASLEELINDDPFGGDDDFSPYSEEDDDFGLGDDDVVNFDDPRARKMAHQDISREREGMDDEPKDFDNVDDEVEYGDEDKEIDELGGMMSAEEEDDVKEIDINELTDMVNMGVKETLSKYFNQ